VFGLSGFEDGHEGARSMDNPSYDYSLFGLQAGFDLYRDIAAEGARRYGGVYGAVGGSSGSVETHQGERAGNTGFGAYTLGGYWTSFGEPGWYIDTLAQGTYYVTDSESVQDVRLDVDGFGLAGSVEAGYPLALGGGLVLEPQAQFVGQTLWLGDSSDGYADIGFDNGSSLATRAGVRIAHTGEWMPDLTVTAWGRADVWYDWLDASPEVTFSSEDGPVEFVSDTDNAWLAFRAGVSTLATERIQLQANVGMQRSLDGSGYGFDGKFGLVVTW
jgi:outer membrane autotransporter protein